MKNLILVLLFVLAQACQLNKDVTSDAYGNFESDPVFVSPDVSGKLVYYAIEEGIKLQKGTLVAIVDSVPTYLNLQELESQKMSVLSKIRNLEAQSGTLLAQKKNLSVEITRLTKLLAANAATQQQMDDLNGKMDVLNSRIRAIKVQQNSVKTEINVLEQKEKEVRDRLARCYIKNPVGGTVLEKYAEASEIAMAGKPLYKIADLNTMKLRVYVTAPLLSGLKLGDPVDVLVDKPDGGLKKLEGRVSWIASEAEFTPKIIQTRDERAKLVYAVKITVQNDGTLKIGMPGEANFHK